MAEPVKEEKKAAVELKVIENQPLPKDAAERGVIALSAKKNGLTATLAVEFGKDLDQKVKLFGKEVVDSAAMAHFKVMGQAVIRTALEAGKKPSEIMAKWKPGVTLPKAPRDPEAVTINYFDTLTEEEKLAMIKKLESKISSK